MMRNFGDNPVRSFTPQFPGGQAVTPPPGLPGASTMAPPGLPPQQARPTLPGPGSTAARPLNPRAPLPRGIDVYGGYTAEQLRKNPALVRNLGKPALARWNAFNQPTAPPPGTQPPPGAGPMPPGAPPPGGGAAPGAPPETNPWGMPPLPPPDVVGLPGQTPEPYAYNDPFSSFLAAVPLMNLNADQQIGNAMANAGFTGNRWGSFAAGKAAEIGAQNALAQNELMLRTLQDYANRSEDRALAATGMGLQTGQALDQMQQDRLRLPFAIGSAEQQRQDNFARLAYEDFERQKLGWLPMLLQAATSQGAGSPGSIYTTTDAPAQPGVADWISLLGQFF